jgi:hypothetical protein
MYIGNFTQCPNMRSMTVYASQCFDIDRMLIITFFHCTHQIQILHQ